MRSVYWKRVAKVKKLTLIFKILLRSRKSATMKIKNHYRKVGIIKKSLDQEKVILTFKKFTRLLKSETLIFGKSLILSWFSKSDTSTIKSVSDIKKPSILFYSPHPVKQLRDQRIRLFSHFQKNLFKPLFTPIYHGNQ